MTPSGTICICANTNLKYQSEDTIVFASESAKRAYFDSKVIKTFTDQMYTRSNTNGVSSTMNGKLYVAPGTSSVKVNCPIGQIYNADYMFYVDSGYSGKTFYNFITDVSYVSDAVTLVTFTEDVFMTWQNNITIQNSFVERETLDSDVPYENSDIPDIISGEYREYGRVDISPSLTNANYGCMVLNTFAFPVLDADLGYAIDTAKMNYGTADVYYGGYEKNQRRLDSLVYVFFPLAALSNSNSNISQVFSAYFTHTVDSHIFNKQRGKYDIISLFSLPEICLPYNVMNYLSGTNDRIAFVIPTTNYNLRSLTIACTHAIYTYQASASEESVNVAYPSQYGGYTFKNKRLYSAPYSYFVLTNNQGQEIRLKPQHFQGSGGQISVDFKMIGSYGTFANVDIFPVGYDITAGSINPTYKESIDNFPEVIYQYDKAADFNQARLISNSISGIGSVTSIGQGIAETLASSNTIEDENEFANSSVNNMKKGTSVGGEIFGALQSYQLSTKWDFPTVQGVDKAGLVPTADNLMKFSLISVGLDLDTAKSIDNLFTRFGYAVKKIKSVSIGLNGRRNFHFVQTSGCNITGSVPMYAKNYLNDRFDKGIRMWSPSYYLSDFENNPIV